MKFDGDTYSSNEDKERLSNQLNKVKELMSDGKWRTINQIKDSVGGSEAGISARLRDLRKERFGGYVVSRRRYGVKSYGLWEYQLVLPTPVYEFVTEPNGQRAFL